MGKSKNPNMGSKCGAKTAAGGTCKMAAGQGTDHLGWGKCQKHGGTSPALKVAAAREETEATIIQLRATFGAGQPVEAEPDKLLLGEVYRSAGVVAWLEVEIGKFDGDITHLTESGTRSRAFIDVFQREREHLAKVCKMTLDAGVAERQVRIAEEQGAMFAKAIQGILADLMLSDAQRGRAPEVVRKHLQALPRVG